MQNQHDGPPKYPDPEFYRNYQAPSYSAPSPAPRLEPVDPYAQAQQQYAPARGHNAFSRFVIAWGGWNRLWIMLGTMALSVVIFYYLWDQSWVFALGLTVLLLIHELGHAFTIRIKKMRATFPIFIPPMGAFVTLPNQPISLRDDAEISLAGPFLGGVASALCFIPCVLLANSNPALSTDFYTLTFYGIFLNLLNLIPVLPLDGGHIGNALSRWLSVLGLAILALAYFATQNFFFLLIGIFGLSYVTQSFNSPVRRVIMRSADRLIVALMYGGLVALLGLGYFALQSPDFLSIFGIHVYFYSGY
jgi:Zn-dependent protease